jgi:hypothetical protein
MAFASNLAIGLGENGLVFYMGAVYGVPLKRCSTHLEY